MKKLVRFVLVWFLLVGTSAMAANTVVIVNESVTVGELENRTVKDMFLGKKAKWDNGDKIIPAILKKGALHEAFLKDVVKKSVKQFATFWKKVVFTGTGMAPQSFGSEADLVKYVAATKGAIGYVSAGTARDGVKTISLK